MGIDGGILRRQKSGPCDGIQAYVCTVGVKSIDEALKAIAANQGQIVQPKAEIRAWGGWPTARTRRAISSASSSPSLCEYEEIAVKCAG